MMARSFRTFLILVAASTWLGIRSAEAQTWLDQMHCCWEQHHAESELVRERNAAWPKPFNCHDRQLYHYIMQANLDAGFEAAHTLSDEHFDPQTHQLNRMGKAKVAWIMQYAAPHQRTIFVYQSYPGDETDLRITSVRDFAVQEFSHFGQAQVAFTQQMPASRSGLYWETVNQRYMEGLPTPVLPVPMASSIQSSSGQ
jgi:hypothetical protein